MTIAAAQASQFYEQVSREAKVFTFTENQCFLVFVVDEKEVVPFWSSRSRVERIQKEHLKYRKYAIDEISLTDFLKKTLVQLEEESIHVGVNWSGKRLTGYDVSVEDLRQNLAYRRSNRRRK